MTWTDGVGGKDLKKKSTYRKTPAEKKKKKVRQIYGTLRIETFR